MRHRCATFVALQVERGRIHPWLREA